jgi:thymidine phosphorylase
MIHLAKKAKSIKEGTKIAAELITRGEAFTKFKEIVKAQGGDISFIDNPEKYKRPRYHSNITSDKPGYIENIDTYEIGMASVELGAGRQTKEDKIDYKAGIIFHLKTGDKVTKGDTIAEIYSDSEKGILSAEERIKLSVQISRRRPAGRKLIKKIIS